MKTPCLLSLLIWSCAAFAADAPPPVYQKTPAPPVQAAPQAAAAVAAPPTATPAPPPSAPAKRSAADLEKLVAPIALYSDPLIATILPASVYPLEIVQAARFVANTNNLAKLDAEPWDENVKAVARVPAVIQKMNDDLPWTIELGEAFLAQDKELMDTIQTLRGKAQKAGTLQTTPQQIVVVTNMVFQKTVEQQVVVVTNTVVQIQPANPQVVYVPTYNPYTVYYPPPAYVYNPYAPLVTFGVGIAVGAIIANNCDWHGGGVYVGHHGAVVWGGGGSYHGDVNVNVDRNVNINNNYNQNVNVNNPQATPRGQTSTTGANQKWQPDQNRVRTSGSPTAAASAGTMEARGWSSGGARPSTQPAAAARPSPSTGTAAARPSTGTPSASRPTPSTGTAATRPSTGTPSASRPTASPSVSRQSPSPSVSQPKSSPSASRPSSSGSAFGGTSSGASARVSSSRGASSRSSGGFSGGRGGGGGGGRR